VFDLHLVGTLEVHDEGVQAAVRVPLQPQQVHVAPEHPVAHDDLQPGLEQDDLLPLQKPACLPDHLRVVRRSVVGVRYASQPPRP
jgi:hypothetical protein